MDGSVSLPLWIFALMALLAAWAALDRLLVPSVRWFIRQRTTRVLEEINLRLDLEIQPFQQTRRQVLVDRLMYDPKVQEAAQIYASAKGMPRDVAMGRVEHYAREIVPAFNAYLYFRIGYALARRLARFLYRVRLGYSDEGGLATIPRGSTVVFVMNHRSNMDYILVGYLAADRAALSYAVGEWAKVWPLQALVRSLGGYFVRRNDRDDLYRRVLERYIAMATEAGVTQALYPEGGLSKDGTLREPKLGILDYMLRDFDPQGQRDLVFIPVGINYDRTLEDRTLLAGLESGAKRRGRFFALKTAARFILRNLFLMASNKWRRLGYACVNFGSPVSMKAYLSERKLDLRRLSKEERFAHVAEIGGRLMDSVGAIVPVVPVALVATVLLQNPESWFSELELKAGAEAMAERLEAAGAKVYIPRKDRDYAVTVGIRMLTLRHLVEERDGLYAPCLDELPVLRYYANSIGHLLPGEEERSSANAAVRV